MKHDKQQQQHAAATLLLAVDVAAVVMATQRSTDRRREGESTDYSAAMVGVARSQEQGTSREGKRRQ